MRRGGIIRRWEWTTVCHRLRRHPHQLLSLLPCPPAVMLPTDRVLMVPPLLGSILMSSCWMSALLIRLLRRALKKVIYFLIFNHISNTISNIKTTLKLANKQQQWQQQVTDTKHQTTTQTTTVLTAIRARINTTVRPIHWFKSENSRDRNRALLNQSKHVVKRAITAIRHRLLQLITS